MHPEAVLFELTTEPHGYDNVTAIACSEHLAISFDIETTRQTHRGEVTFSEVYASLSQAWNPFELGGWADRLVRTDWPRWAQSLRGLHGTAIAFGMALPETHRLPRDRRRAAVRIDGAEVFAHGQ